MILILLLALLWLLGPALGQAPKLSIRNKNFIISASVRVDYRHENNNNNNSYLLYRIEGSYSAQQERSRIAYEIRNQERLWQAKFSGLPTSGTFFADQYSVLLLDNNRRQGCRPSEFQTLASVSQLELFDLKTPTEELYLAGPVQLLHWLDDHREELREIEGLFNYSEKRNTPTVAYRIKYKSARLQAQDELIEIYVYYPKNHTQEAVPLEVLFLAPDAKEVSYQFSRVQLEQQYSEDFFQLHRQIDSQVVMDLHAVERAAGCSLAGSKQRPLGPDKIQSRFSFRAHISHSSRDENFAAFVGYESAIDSLRVDKLDADVASSTITNFYLRKSYHILKRKGDDKKVLGKMTAFQRQNELSCLITETSNPQRFCPFQTSDLIAGLGPFVLLGEAKVRGIQAKVYEAYNSTWPIWMDPSVVHYVRSLGSRNGFALEVRHSNGGSPNVILNTVLYISEGTWSEYRPVLIEVSKINVRDWTVMDKTMIEIYDFTWELEQRAPSGQRSDEYFSLADVCSANSVANRHFGQVDMLLAAERRLDDPEPEWLLSKLRRNFALLQAIQSFFDLPVTMVYDLESRLRRSDLVSRSDSYESLALPVSFRTAEHRQLEARLVLCGSGSPKAERKRQLLQLRTSLRACFLLAAHQRQNTFFAHSTPSDLCYIDLQPESTALAIKDSFGVPNPSAFEFHEDGSMEVFFVNHTELRQSEDKLTGLAHGRLRLRYLQELSKLPLVDTHREGSMDFFIKSMNVFESNEKFDSTNDDDDLMRDTNTFAGFGLLESDPSTSLVVAQKVNENNWQPSDRIADQVPGDTRMSFDQCQAACLADPSCQSFSLCIEAAEVRCLISSHNFKTETLARQILRFKDKPSAPRPITLNVDELRTVQLRRNLNCELHNKIYANLFSGPTRVSQSFLNRRLHPVSGREQCARLCVEQTMRLIREDVNQARLLSSAALTNHQTDSEAIKSAVADHQRAHSDICRAYLFIDAAELAPLTKEFQDKVKSRALNESLTQDTSGYCMVGDRLTKQEQAQLLASKKYDLGTATQYLKLQRYAFKFETMFERQYNVALKKSLKSYDELLAYRDVTEHPQMAPGQSFELMRAFDARNENSQERMLADETKCALVCFSQSWGPWPACRSFDIHVMTANNKSLVFCHLNSISLLQALKTERFDLIDDHPMGSVRVIHYDPRPGFIKTETEQAGLLEMARLALMAKFTPKSSIGFLSSLCIASIALICGLLAGSRLASKWSSYSSMMNQQCTESDARYLVGNQTIEFSSLADMKTVDE